MTVEIVMLSLSDFDYHLPEGRIALHPAAPRESAKLLRVRPDAEPVLSDFTIDDLPDLLQSGDLIVFNDTKVIPARLIGQRVRGENVLGIEALLLKRLDPSRWSAFAKPGKRLKPGDILIFGELTGEILTKGEEGIIEIRFALEGAMLDAAIAAAGEMPLPPYILEARRAMGEAADQAVDAADYQPVFATKDGAVAAPTASLHFTPDLLARIAKGGVSSAYITLHVGAGTFLPVKTEDLNEHRMHAEWGEISAEVAARINETKMRGGRVIAVGTTVLRLLESAFDEGNVQPFFGETAIFLKPGVNIRSADMLLTNFHLPKSTLLMLVSAFSGLETMRAAYRHAVEGGYRFFSYGDACLLTLANKQ